VACLVWQKSLGQSRGHSVGATHERYHSEFKSDLDLERLPSGKFDCNDLNLQCAVLASNSLRPIGQLGLTGEISPVRHPAKRRLKTSCRN